jgi:hypothetical protein
MIRIALALLFTLESAFGQRILEREAIVVENFQGDSLGQFTSYPPVQDAGYDPSLSPTTELGAPGGRALMRILKPVRRGPERVGFLRRLNLIATENGSVEFDYRLDHASPGDRIEIGIAGANGTLGTTTLPAGNRSVWSHVKVATKLNAGTGIDGVYITAELSQADPDITYYFFIDNVRIHAAEAVRFALRAPRAVPLAHWPELFATRTYGTGKPVRVEAAAPVALTAVTCAVHDGAGRVAGKYPLYDDGSHGDARGGDGIWSNASVLAGNTEPDVYTLHVHGTTAAGGLVTTAVRVLRVPAARTHPRLYFDANDRERLAARTQQPRYARAWATVIQEAEASRKTGDLTRANAVFNLLDRQFLLPTLPGYFDLLTKARVRIQSNLLPGWITPDPAARAAAKDALIAISHWNSWVPPWFEAHGQHTYYPAGELAANAALAYDVLYDELSPAERSTVRDALLQRAIIPTFREYVADNRIPANTSNWIGHTVGGALLAGMAIAGESDSADLPLYINGLLRKLEDHLAASYLKDGSYGEGISYQEFDLETTGPTLIALERVFGLPYWARTHVKDSLWFPVSTLAQPAAGSLDMGDSHPPSGRTIAPVVARSQNPAIDWFADRLGGGTLYSLLFGDDSIKGQPPEGTGSRWFREKGNVVFRTGWEPNDTIVLFRAGPNFNHNHADQGSFLLRAAGENLVNEAGWSDYYKDPYYDSYFKQAAGHNTVLVDGDPASQSVADTLMLPGLHRYPQIEDVFLSDAVEAVTSELAPVYRGRLQRFSRRLVFLKPDLLVIADDLRSAGPPARFDWLLHLPDRARLERESNLVLYGGPAAALAVRTLLPPAAETSITPGHIPYSVFNPVAPVNVPAEPAILDVRTASSATARILTVLAPGDKKESVRSRVMNLQPIDAAAGFGFEAADQMVLFRGERPPLVHAGWRTDATVLVVRGKPGSPRVVGALTSTRVQHDARILFSSDHPVSIAIDYERGRVQLNAQEPSRVEILGRDDKMMRISVPAGDQQFALDARSAP